MGQILSRLLQVPDITKHSTFLWGPRRTGKSHWIRQNLPNAELIDLLKTDVLAEYATRPALLRERFESLQKTSPGKPIVIDEVQKCPALLDEVHWLIENASQTFLLTGSSARKLRHSHSNLLGGRARRRELRPLCYPEITNFKLESAMISGFLPPHFLSEQPEDELRGYIADYLTQEIAQEGLVRDLPAFSDFLRVAAITSSEMLNYTNVSREVGVSAKVVREYFQILEDTLLGFRIQPWRKSKNRRMVETEKFYLFDVGVTNYLAKRKPAPATPEFGKSLEQFILMELLAYKAYRSPDMELTFWRTSNRQEVDFLINDREVAIEIKGSSRVHEGDLRWLTMLSEDGSLKTRIVVSLERQERRVSDRYGEIVIMPWDRFLESLWHQQIIR